MNKHGVSGLFQHKPGATCVVCDRLRSREFTANDPEVRDIAAIFALKGWEWGVRNGEAVEKYVPKAGDIARTLNRLYDSCTSLPGYPLNAGSSHSGRLFVSYIDEGYGHEVTFGIDWSRLPGAFGA